MTKPENLPALLATIKTRAHTEAVLRLEDPYYDLDKGAASAWDKTVTPDSVLRLVHEIENLQSAADDKTHEFTGTVHRADGITVTATITVPEAHHMIEPDPARPWDGPDRGNRNFVEIGELAMMVAQQGYNIVERNERSRERWNRRDYWADLLDIDPPTPAIEAPKDDVVYLVGTELPGER